MKKVLFYVLLVLLPFIGYGIDLEGENFKKGLSATFDLWPLVVFSILADIVFAAIVFWLVRQSAKTHISAAAAIIFTLLGLAVICIPLLFKTNLGALTQYFPPLLPDHRSIASAFVLITSLAALIWKPKPAAS